MASVQIYDGNPIWISGITPFGFYDEDRQYQADSPKVAKFVAQRLGYPLMDVELQSGSIFTCFEEAITTYGNQIYAWKVKENYLSLEGGSKDMDANNIVLEPSLQRIIEISKNYGTEADVGGNVTLYHGMLDVKAHVQDYDLDKWAEEQGIQGGIEIRKVYYEAPPAILRYFDPYAGTGTGIQSLMDAFDFGSYSPGVNFLLMPVSADILKIQAIEFNDQVRRSGYSFRISNNQLSLFPIPAQDGKLRIEYYKLSDKRKLNTAVDYTNVIETLRMPIPDTIVPEGSEGVTHTFVHNLDTTTVSIECYTKVPVGDGETYHKFIPKDVVIQDKNTVDIKFNSNVTDGYVIISYPLLRTFDSSGITSFASQNIAYTAYAGQTIRFEHKMKTTGVSTSVYYYKNGEVLSMIPEEIRVVSDNVIDITFAEATAGYVVISANVSIDPESGGVITNISEVPYENPVYSKINSIGRQWIFRYTLALCKEILAYVRGKYQTVPIPDSEATLNHSDLLTDARKEKEDLLKELTDMLDTTSREAQLERKSKEAEYLRTTLGGVPMCIFIG